MRELQPVLDQAHARLRVAEGSRIKRGRGALPTERHTIESADASVQKARAAMARQDYLGAREAIRGVAEQLQAVIRQIDTRAAAPAARRRR